MHIPDVVGYSLEEAGALLAEEGIKIHKIKVTAPPRHKDEEYNKDFKVVRLMLIDHESVELLICDSNLG